MTNPSRLGIGDRGCACCMAVVDGESTLLGVLGALSNGVNLKLMRVSMCERHNRALDVVIAELRQDRID